MRFKLDENLPHELTLLFLQAGHDASTALEQGLKGSRDSDLMAACAGESRTMVTFDKDFADIRTYPPARHAGIVVFRLESQARDHVLEVAGRFLNSLPQSPIAGQLWIVEESRIRVRR